MNFLFSIIIPFYNSKNLLIKNYNVIKKIVSRFENVEAIYVDNNSTDGSYNDFKKKINHKNIKIFKTNKIYGKGPGVARNLGIKKSNSLYLLFMDIDDEIKILNFNKLKTLLMSFKPNLIHLKKKSYKKLPPIINYTRKNLHIFFRKSNNMESIGILINKKFLLKNKINFPVGIYEDIIFNFKINFFNNKKIFFFKKFHYIKKYYKYSITNSILSTYHLRCKYYAWKNINLFLKKELNAVNYKKIFKDIQFRLRGELSNEILNIKKCNIAQNKKRNMQNYIVKKYKKLINSDFVIKTKKDLIIRKYFNDKKI